MQRSIISFLKKYKNPKEGRKVGTKVTTTKTATKKEWNTRNQIINIMDLNPTIFIVLLNADRLNSLI